MRDDPFEWLEPLVPYFVGYLLFLIVLRALLLWGNRRVRQGGVFRPLVRLLLCLLRSSAILGAVLLTGWVLASLGLFAPVLEFLEEMPVVESERFDIAFSLGWVLLSPLLLLFAIWVFRLFFGCIIRPRKPLYAYLFFWR